MFMDFYGLFQIENSFSSVLRNIPDTFLVTSCFLFFLFFISGIPMKNSLDLFSNCFFLLPSSFSIFQCFVLFLPVSLNFVLQFSIVFLSYCCIFNIPGFFWPLNLPILLNILFFHECNTFSYFSQDINGSSFISFPI